MAKKGLLVLVLASVLAGGVWAQDEAVSKITLHGGLAVGNASISFGDSTPTGNSAIGVDVSGDYRLPMKLPLSVGAEVALLNSSEGKVGAFAILVRAAYHFNKNPKLDIYPLFKIGYDFGFGDMADLAEDGLKGAAFGLKLGVAYYFTSKLGAFAEAGIESYSLIKNSGANKPNLEVNHGFTIGVSYKL
jgi:hypothetical protein